MWLLAVIIIFLLRNITPVHIDNKFGWLLDEMTARSFRNLPVNNNFDPILVVVLYFCYLFKDARASWLRGDAFVFGAGSLRFKSRAGQIGHSVANSLPLFSGAGGLSFNSRAGQIGHSVANGSPPLRHYLEKSCVARAQRRRDRPRKLVTRFGVLPRV